MLSRKSIAWALYDWANSAFALSVLAVLFPIFLGSYWSVGDSGADVTARLGLITAAAAFIVSVRCTGARRNCRCRRLSQAFPDDFRLCRRRDDGSAGVSC